jgi:hypothetical protein
LLSRIIEIEVNQEAIAIRRSAIANSVDLQMKNDGERVQKKQKLQIPILASD